MENIMPDEGRIHTNLPAEKDDANRQLATFIAKPDLNQVQDDAWLSAVRQIVDTVAVGWAGSSENGATQASELAFLEGCSPIARLWGRAEKTSVSQAAFVNAVSAAALDYDCVHQDSLLHPAAITVPVALAIGADTGASGEKVVAAHIIGTEVMCRISLATPRQSNWFPASVYGIFGAAATAASLLDLDEAQTLDALGLALAQASGTKQAISERTIAKRYQSAFAARAGILSAVLAKRGVTGANQVLDGAAGLFALYETGDPDKVVAGLGHSFTFDRTTIKIFPTCLCTHVIIEAMQRLMAKHGFSQDDVAKLKVRITPYMNRIVGGEYEPSANPQVAAQFSARYAAARTLFSGGIKLSDIEPEKALDPDVVRLAQDIELTLFQDIDGHVSPCDVAVVLNNGATFTEHVSEVPNAAFGADADVVLAEKARDCLMRGVSPMTADAAEGVIARLLTMREAPSIAGLFNDT